MHDEPHILDAALREVIGGQTPPDLIAATLAKAGVPVGATQGSPLQKAESPAASASRAPIPLRRSWLRWPLAAAASAALATFLFWQFAVVPESELAGAPDRQAVSQVDQEPQRKPRSGEPRINFSTSNENTENIGGVPGDPHDRPVGDVKMGLGRKHSAAPSETHKNHGTNAFIDTEDDKLSTFAIDVDTGAYTKSRGYLNSGQRPPEEAVRVEEFVNFFKYDYPQPAGDAPFSLTLDGAPSRYGANLKNCYLLRVGLKAREISAAERKPANLTFLIDASGSMEGEKRMGLVKRSLALLVEQMREGDQIGIVVFGSTARMHMEYRDASSKDAIIAKIDELKCDGVTNMDEGLNVAYSMAENALRPGFINRVILCSDGEANVGATTPQALLEKIAEKRRKGITLTSVGFGMGGYNDHLMEQLGDKGDGHYAFVDSLEEAKRVFVDNLNGTLQVVARDVKVQLEFNPEVVKSWRLVGYENRDVADKDFRNDAVDGGEVGAGHSVTALYEVKLVESVNCGRIATATVRYKHDEREGFREVYGEIFVPQLAPRWELAAQEFRLAANVAEFAEILRNSFWAKECSLDAVLEDLNTLTLRDDKLDELKELVRKAKTLK